MDKLPNFLHSIFLTCSFLSLIFTTCGSLKPYHFSQHGIDTYKDDQSRAHTRSKEAGEMGMVGMELYPTGSSLPDCSHACGPCTPCLRVIVSFKKCSVESCPVVYRCMCKGKYYHVPSN